MKKLKCNTRHSWTSTGRQESVAEHSWRLAVMALLVKDCFADTDIEIVIKMCLIHDIGEALTGDIPAFQKTSADEENEAEAVKKLLLLLPEKLRLEFNGLFDQMMEQSSPEAKLFKALDNMEALISHNEAPISTWLEREYEDNITYGTKNVAWSDWLRQLKEEIKQDSLKKIQGGKLQNY